jgi:hypothetical protein
MRLFATCDFNWESGIEKVLDHLIDLKMFEYFEDRQYWGSLSGISVVLMCRDANLKFKRRIRLSRKETVIYMDIMFDLKEMSKLPHEKRVRLVAERIREEVPEAVSKYPVNGFDFAAFSEDFRGWFERLS